MAQRILFALTVIGFTVAIIAGIIRERLKHLEPAHPPPESLAFIGTAGLAAGIVFAMCIMATTKSKPEDSKTDHYRL